MIAENSPRIINYHAGSGTKLRPPSKFTQPASYLMYGTNDCPEASEFLAPIVLMHMKGTPETMNSLATYSEAVVTEAPRSSQGRRTQPLLG